MKMSIKFKISVVLALLIILTVAALSVLVLKGIENNQRNRVEEELLQKSEVAKQSIRQSYLTEDNSVSIESFLQQKAQRLASSIALQSGLQTVIYNQKGMEEGSSLPIGQRDVEIADTLSYALKGQVAYETKGSSLFYVAPLSIENQQIGAIRFDYSLADNQEFLAEIKRLFLIGGIASAGAAILIGYLYFYRIANRVTTLKNASFQLQNGTFLDSPPFQGRDELGELSSGLYVMSTAIQRSIAELNEEKRKLELAVVKLQALEQQQKQFIGNISHEFKTPLTSIKAYVDLLDMYRDDPQLLEDGVENIRKETGRLHEMVDKILRLAELERYDFEQIPQHLQLDEVVADVCKRMQGKATKFNLKLKVNVHKAVVFADRESLFHIFMNLIDNAIKYNEAGGEIVVTSHQDNEHVAIDVANTGAGIPMDAREKLFQPFFTVNKDRSRISGGTGLGLALVKKLTEKQQGYVELRRSDMEWTLFRVTFPRKLNEESK